MKKKILIAGASKNLGKYLSEALSKNYQIISTSRNVNVKKKNSYICDFTSADNTKNFLLRIKNKYPDLNCIIYTIGDSKNYKTSNFKEKIYKKFETNFLTFYYLLEFYCEVFKFKPIKFIIFSSIVTEKTILDAPIEYASFKSALNTYAKYKAKQLASKNISINIISPGNILLNGNNWAKRLKSDKLKTLNYIKKNVPLNKFVDAQTLLDICIFLINDKKNIVTGSNIIVDGGQSL